MPWLNKRLRQHTLGMAAFLGILLVSFMSCKSPNSTDDDITGIIIAVNDCGTMVDIIFDGVFQNSIESGVTSTVATVNRGSYYLEAKITGTETVVHSATINVNEQSDYYFIIEGPSTISVTNHYGEILKIYIDGDYLGDIADNLTQTIRKVRFGTYNFEAQKKSDGTPVASTTIEVNEIKEYTWTITK